jgi:hypothetical protein
MNVTYKSKPSVKGHQLLETLQKAVDQTLERKRQLGQYAVTWKDKRLRVIGKDASSQDET